MHLSQITPSIFSSLGLDSAIDHLAVGQSPMGRELLFLIDGFGFDTLSQYADVMPTMSRMFNHGLEKAEKQGVTGKAVTPFLLEHFHTTSKGESLAINTEIIKANCLLGAQIAVALQ